MGKLLDRACLFEKIISMVDYTTNLTESNGDRLMYLSGSHYRMGLSTGRKIRELCAPQSICPPDRRRQSMSPERFIHMLDHYAPELSSEFVGLAEGLDYSRNEAAEHLAVEASRGVGCSAFWASEDHTIGQFPLFGRNWDYRPHAAENARVVQTHPVRGYSHLGFTNHPIGRYGGINETGLTVATAVVPARENGDGLSFTLAVRRILETCSSAEDACDFLENIPHRSAVNFLLADPHGHAEKLEIEPGRLLKQPAGDFAAITNHFQSIPEHQARPKLLKSRQRLKNLHRWFRANSGQLDIGQTREILADREDGICARGNPNVDFATVTLWSWIARPGQRTLEVAMGSPHNTAFESRTLADEKQLSSH